MTRGSGALVLIAAALCLAAAPRSKAPLVIDRDGDLSVVEAPAQSVFDACVLIVETEKDAGATTTRRVSSLCDDGDGPRLAPVAETTAEALSVTPRLGPDRALDLLVGLDGGLEVWRVPERGVPATLVARLVDPRLGPVGGDLVDLDGDGTDDLIESTYEGLAAFRRTATGFEALSTAPLPPRAVLAGERLRVMGSAAIAATPAGLARYTTPLALEGDRWRVFRIPLGPAGAGEPCAAWIDAKADLRIVSSTVLDGDPPRLVAMVQPGDRLALMGEQEFVVAPIVCRASARGEPFELKLETRHPNFSPTAISLEDVTGDGILDAVIRGIVGRVTPDPLVTVFPGLPGGRFSAKPLDWDRKAKKLDRSIYSWPGSDLDGDGTDDLIYLEQRALSIVRGTAPDGRSVPLERKPSASIDLPEKIDAGGRGNAILSGPSGRWFVFAGTREAEKERKKAVVALPLP
jgi:hypothetical protein